MSDDGNLLVRWSKRKHAARRGNSEAPAPQKPARPAVTAEPEPAVATDGVSPTAAHQAATAPSAGAAEAPAAEGRIEDLPAIETLTYESDFSVFMQAWVPESMRQRALRKLWTSHPVLANLDGLNDYDPQTFAYMTQLKEFAEPVEKVSRIARDTLVDPRRYVAAARDPVTRRAARRDELRQARQADDGHPPADVSAASPSGGDEPDGVQPVEAADLSGMGAPRKLS